MGQAKSKDGVFAKLRRRRAVVQGPPHLNRGRRHGGAPPAGLEGEWNRPDSNLPLKAGDDKQTIIIEEFDGKPKEQGQLSEGTKKYPIMPAVVFGLQINMLHMAEPIVQAYATPEMLSSLEAVDPYDLQSYIQDESYDWELYLQNGKFPL